jgi:hypothetical protein
MIRLKTLAKLENTICMLCLPPDQLEFQTENCTVVGYGRPNLDGIGNNLASDEGDGKNYVSKQQFLERIFLTLHSFFLYEKHFIIH